MKFFVAAGSLFLLSGCYFADDLFLEQPPPPEKSLQDRSQEAVEAYIKNGITSETYLAFGFTNAVIHVPAELLEVEKLEEDRDKGINTGPQADSLIRVRRNRVEANHIQRTVYIEHFFTLKTKAGQLQILEAGYTLDDTLGVMDVKPITVFEMPSYYETALNYFFFNYTLFASPTISEARALSNRFYTFFQTELDRRTDVASRSDFYKNCVKITSIVRTNGAFDPGTVAQSLISDYVVERLDSTVSHKALRFSPLYEKSEGTETNGYYIFYKFSEMIYEQVDTAVVRFDFSKYYEIQSTVLVDPPFDSYFLNP